MAESVLKKEFQQRDVTRLRNLFGGKVDAATGIRVGYTKQSTDRKEGDIWTEEGKQWTIKDGIKQTYTKLSSIRKVLSVPFCCPKCSSKMSNKLDSKFYNLHGHCFTCQIQYETQLRIDGKYDEYAKSLMTANALTFVEDARGFINEIGKVDNGTYDENGMKQNWSGPAINHQVLNQMTKEIDELEEKIK